MVSVVNMKKELILNEGVISAEKTRDVYAKYYDSMTAGHVEDLPMYQQIASIKTPPYLEVGCGTGRVLLHLLSKKPDATQGHYLTGVDISDAMLFICRRKTNLFIDDGSLQVTKHDFSIDKLRGQRFHAAFVTFFTFNYIPKNLQSNFLANISKSLHSDGIITLDCFYPHLKWHPEKAGQWIDNEPIFINDRRIGFKQKTQMVAPTIEKTEWMFIEPDGVINTASRSKIYVSPQKGISLLKAVGFTDIQRLFDYKMPGTDDFAEGSQGFNFVLTARKP